MSDRTMHFKNSCTFTGPVAGPAISGFINQHTHWRWTYWVIVIWAGVELALLVFVSLSTSFLSTNMR